MVDMYEHRTAPLFPFRKSVRRCVRHTAVSCLILISPLLIGVVGYHSSERLSWIDALMNTSMILGRLGPVDVLHAEAGRVFASFSALFSGVVLPVIAGVIIAPLAHRSLHGLLPERSGSEDH